MARVRWSKDASRDYWDIVGFIERHSPTAALRLGDAFEEAADRLVLYPELGRAVPEFHDWSFRELIVQEYRFIYRVAGDDVTILALVHGSRDLWRRLPSGPWDID